MNTVSRGIRNAFRNMIRTISIVVIIGLSIGLALSMLIARTSVTEKIETVKTSVGNTVSISPAGARGFDGGGEPLTSTQASKVASLAHVASMVQTVSDRLTTENTSLQSAIEAGSLGQRNSQRSGVGFTQQPPTLPEGGRQGTGSAGTSGTVQRTFTPPVTLLGTTDPSATTSAEGSAALTIKSGKVFANTSTDNVAIIGTALATKNNLQVGSTFTAYGTAITVVGIFDSGTQFGNNQVVMPLATVQKLSSQVDQLTSITLKVDSVDNIASVAAATKTALGSSVDVTDSASTVKSAVAPLESIQTISLYSLLGALVAGSIIILLTMIMIVRERRKEIGVIKAIGSSNFAIMSQFVVEAITLTALGSIIGIGIGVVASAPLTSVLVSTTSATTESATPGRGFGSAGRLLAQSAQNVQTSVGWEIILYGLGVALLIAIIGSAIASLFISKIRPAEVMRAE